MESAERRADTIHRPRLFVRNSFCINFNVPLEAIARHAAVSTLLMMCAKFCREHDEAGIPEVPIVLQVGGVTWLSAASAGSRKYLRTSAGQESGAVKS